MRKLARTILLFALAAAVAAPAMAQDKKKGKKKRAGKARGPIVFVYRLPRAVTKTLTADQKTKLQAINKEYRPKLLEIRKKQGAILTADQKAVLEKARKSGTTARERQAALRAARKSLKFTSDQKKQQADLRKQERTLRAEINKKVDSVLTDEQKELRKKASKRKGGKKGKKKAAA
jgi:oligoendopeptidase F